MRTISLSGAIIELHDSGLTVTKYPGLKPIPAYPQDNDTYKERAIKLGYGQDTMSMSREHELMHHLIAKWLGQPHSHTLVGVAKNDYWPTWGWEEDAVMSLQSFARRCGISVERLALALSSEKG